MGDRIDILGIGFDDLTLTGAIDRACDMLDQPRNHMIVTPNSEIVYMARNDQKLKDTLNRADMVVPDGIGVVQASRTLKTPLTQKVAGVELGEGLVERLSKSGRGLFLLGAKPGVAQAAADKLCEKYPGLVISGVRVLFVCLGAPKQERWMEEHADELHTRLMLGLGGSLDIFAGVAKRAPEIWIRLGLEWLYRLMKQPSRIGRMLALPKFTLAVRQYARKRKK